MILTDEEKTTLKEYLTQNIKYYGPKAQNFWRFQFNPNQDYPYDFVSQVYTYLFDNYINWPYKVFVKHVMSKFPNLSQKQILEVASGYLPGLSLTLQRMVSIKNPIVCMDSIAIPLEVPGIITIKDALTLDSNIDNTDLILAHCPCESLDTIVYRAIEEKKELCVQTCPCGHNLSSFQGFNYYIASLMADLKELEDDGFIIECETTDSYDITRSPVITARKRIK